MLLICFFVVVCFICKHFKQKVTSLCYLSFKLNHCFITLAEYQINKRFMLINFFALINTFFTLISAFIKQKRFVKRKLVPIIETEYLTNDGTLPNKKKLLFNYSTLVPMLLGTAYCTLRGYKIKPVERCASTMQGAFSVLGDSFFDNNLIPDKNLDTLFEQLYDVKGTNSIELLFINLFKHYWETGCTKHFKKYFYKIYEAEINSKIQELKKSTYEEIEKATELKGGYSMLFYRTAFEHGISENEEALLYKLGKAVQLANDAFDIYKDYKSGVRTMVTECNNFGLLKKEFLKLINEIKQLAYKVNVPKRNIKRFLQIMSLSLFSRTLVCFDALQKNQINTGGKFEISSYKREQLVVDMEKPTNIIRMLKCFLKMSYDINGLSN